MESKKCGVVSVIDYTAFVKGSARAGLLRGVVKVLPCGSGLCREYQWGEGSRAPAVKLEALKPCLDGRRGSFSRILPCLERGQHIRTLPFPSVGVWCPRSLWN